MVDPWRVLESLRAPAATAAAWRRALGDRFDSMASAFLCAGPDHVSSVSCPRDCGCAHEVVRFGPQDLIAVCRCPDQGCEDFEVAGPELLIWKLSWRRLAAGLCQALGLHLKPVDLKIPATWQVGSWGCQTVPAILTIQHSRLGFQQVVVTLVARMRGPFILLAPTERHFDVASTELLASVGAATFALSTQVQLMPSGSLRSLTTPGELFARFNPAPKAAVDEDLARRAFALVQQLDQEDSARPPSVLTVFRLYCMEELSAGQIARRCGSSKATVIRRLRQIHQRIGMKPQALRQVSSHFDKIEDTLADPRASRIYRRKLMENELADDEP